MLKKLLEHPLTRGLDLDDPQTTQLRRQIIRDKPFLRAIYDDWYNWLASIDDGLPVDGWALELGSGAGWLDEVLPRLITSDVFACDGLKLVADARRLPFPDASLRAIYMVDVLHHIPVAKAFLYEAARCVPAGGVIAMIEPWNSAWGRWVYQHLHHEPFRPDAEDWSFPGTGPLSGANGALPWIMFERDRKRFEAEHAGWRLRTVEPFMPMRYLVSGGVSMRALMPGWSTGLWRGVERLTRSQHHRLGMFAKVVLERVAG
ncbi:MAG: methyltransferase domain-containing protein [Planctomycetota bacterium]